MNLRPLRTHGRHRVPTPPLTFTQRVGVAGALVVVASAGSIVWPVIASADAPMQTAWWNMATSGQAPPDPATPPGGLHISVISNNVLAFGAVEYSLPAGASAQLVLQVAQAAAPPAVDTGNPSPTPAFRFQACPTIGAWRGGDDQPAASAPTYDTKHCFSGNESADAKTLTFFVDGNHQRKPGQLSLAIVPLPTDQLPTVGGDSPVDPTPPTSVDVDKPDAGSLTVTGGGTTLPPPVASGSNGTTSPATASGGQGTASTASAGGSPAVNGGGSVPPIDTGPSVTTTQPDAGVSPVVAGSPVSPNTAPAAATAPVSGRGHNWALVLLLLLGFALLASMIQRNNAAVPIGERGLGRFRQSRQRQARPLI